MMIRMAGVALALMMSGMATAGEGTLKDTLLAREVEILEAIKHKDSAALTELLSEQAYCIRPGYGRFKTDSHLINLDGETLSTYSLRNVDCVQVADDVAMLTYEYTMTGSRNGGEYTADRYATSTWALRDGQWMSVFYQETAVGER